MDSYITIKQTAEYYFEDRKSEFYGFAKPIDTESEAIDFINAVKKKYPDARHWVYAYVLRENSVMRYTDDREPQGTAGMPVLDALRKNGVTNAVIVVVRYFGGILLGTGGLVHAYSEAALGALRNAVIIKYSTYARLEMSLSYADFQKTPMLFKKYDFATEDTEYYESVKIIGSVIADSYDEFVKELSEATSGRSNIVLLEKKFDFRE